MNFIGVDHHTKIITVCIVNENLRSSSSGFRAKSMKGLRSFSPRAAQSTTNSEEEFDGLVTLRSASFLTRSQG